MVFILHNDVRNIKKLFNVLQFIFLFLFFLFLFFFFLRITGKTCSEIKLYSPQATSGSYVIDPDGEGGYEPFTVYCDMTDKNGVGVTIVGHDSETRTLVNGYEAAGSYVRHVHYIGAGLTNVPQLVGLLDMSALIGFRTTGPCRL